MKKVCRNCNKEYDFCPSCILTRPYIQKFCSVKCREEFVRKNNIKVDLSNSNGKVLQK